MPYQPTHPHPYLESIDVSGILGNIFSVIVNPKDIITKYNLSICESESTAAIYTTGDIELSTPIYGSENGTVLTIDVPNNSGMANGHEYKWTIKLYSVDGASITSPYYYFSAKTDPKIEFNYIPDTLSSCEYTFSATYEQEQNEKYMYYKYELYSDGILIDSTDEKMDALLSYTYDGLISGNNYCIKLTIVTNDRHSYTISKSFSVEYETQSSIIMPRVTADKSQNCINVDFSQNVFIKGHTNSEIEYRSFSDPSLNNAKYATVPSGGYIYYNKLNEYQTLNLGEDFTIYYNVHFHDFFTGDILTLMDELSGTVYNVRYDGRKFYYKIGNNPELFVDPYVDSDNIHQELSSIHNSDSTISDINYNTLYMLYENDVLNSDSVFLYNDITANFWWTFVLMPDRLLAYKGEKYIESTVN